MPHRRNRRCGNASHGARPHAPTLARRIAAPCRFPPRALPPGAARRRLLLRRWVANGWMVRVEGAGGPGFRLTALGQRQLTDFLGGLARPRDADA